MNRGHLIYLAIPCWTFLAGIHLRKCNISWMGIRIGPCPSLTQTRFPSHDAFNTFVLANVSMYCYIGKVWQQTDLFIICKIVIMLTYGDHLWLTPRIQRLCQGNSAPASNCILNGYVFILREYIQHWISGRCAQHVERCVSNLFSQQILVPRNGLVLSEKTSF